MMGGGGMMNGLGGFGGGFGLFGGLLSLIINIGVVVGIVILVIWAVRKISSNGSNASMSWGQASQSQVQSPREILQTRYARGELTREQYQQMLSDLG